MNKDLTVGKPETVLWQFCLPLFGSIIFQQLYNIADSLVAGRFIGENALAAVGNRNLVRLANRVDNRNNSFAAVLSKRARDEEIRKRCNLFCVKGVNATCSVDSSLSQRKQVTLTQTDLFFIHNSCRIAAMLANHERPANHSE